MRISELNQNDISDAIALVWDVFNEFEVPDYSEQGVETFRKFLSSKEDIGILDFYGSNIENQLVGIIAMRKSTHISMLFVKKEFHRQGIAKALFLHVLDISGADKITVNSSPYAVGVYHKLGFMDTGKEQIMNGMRFTPMCFTR